MSTYAKTRLYPFPMIHDGLFAGLSGLETSAKSVLEGIFSSLMQRAASAAAMICFPLIGIHQNLLEKPHDGAQYCRAGRWARAIIVESILIAIYVRAAYEAAPQVFGLWVLFVGGVHFLTMGFRRGYPIAIVGVFCILQAVSGLLLLPFPMRLFRLFDSLLRAGFSWRMLGIQALENAMCGHGPKAFISN